MVRRSFEEKQLSLKFLLEAEAEAWNDVFWPTEQIRVLTSGAYDMLHVGHIQYLESAAALGGMLIVGVDSDARIKKSKGEFRPIFLQDERLAIVSALGCVTYALIFDDMRELMDAVRPQIMVVSPTSSEDTAFDRLAYAESKNIHVQAIPPRSNMHTSDHLHRILARFANRE